MEIVPISDYAIAEIKKNIAKHLSNFRKKKQEHYLKEERARLEKEKGGRHWGKIFSPYSQQEVARLLGSKQPNVSKFENGTNQIDFYTLCQLAVLYEVDIEDLLPLKYLNNLDRKSLSKDNKRSIRKP